MLTVFPLRMILSESLLILIAIVIEAFCLQKFLRISPKVSVEYAIVINLLANLWGWSIFFIVTLFPLSQQKVILIEAIFFNHVEPIAGQLILIAFVTFCATFFFKLRWLKMLEISWCQLEECYQLSHHNRIYSSIFFSHFLSNVVSVIILFYQSFY